MVGGSTLAGYVLLDHNATVLETNENLRLTPGRFVQLGEGSDPAAPPANEARLFLRDVSGKTQLAIRFPTGAVQAIATEL